MFRNLNTEALGITGQDSEIIELALSFGFKGLDLDLVDFAARVEAQGLPKTRRLIDSARLKVGSFRLPTTWQDDEATYQQCLKQLPQLAELAQQMGCTRAITAIEPASDMRPYHENFQFHTRRFNDLGEKLAQYNIRLGVEVLAPSRLRDGHAFGFIQTFDAVVMLLRSVTAANVGLALDVWHWHLAGGTMDQVRALGNKIVTVALADAEPNATAANADEQTRRLPGETGVIDSAAMVKLLNELRYDGPITPKPHPQRFQGRSRDKIVKQAGESLDQVWQAAGIVVPGRKRSLTP